MGGNSSVHLIGSLPFPSKTKKLVGDVRRAPQGRNALSINKSKKTVNDSQSTTSEGAIWTLRPDKGTCVVSINLGFIEYVDRIPIHCYSILTNKVLAQLTWCPPSLPPLQFDALLAFCSPISHRHRLLLMVLLAEFQFKLNNPCHSHFLFTSYFVQVVWSVSVFRDPFYCRHVLVDASVP